MTVRWSHTALDDLNRIHDFVAEDSPNAAARLQERLFAAAERLNVFAARGRRGRIAGTRELVIAPTPYLIVYAEDAGTVILRVLHGRQLWPPDGDR